MTGYLFILVLMFLSCVMIESVCRCDWCNEITRKFHSVEGVRSRYQIMRKNLTRDLHIESLQLCADCSHWIYITLEEKRLSFKKKEE